MSSFPESSTSGVCPSAWRKWILKNVCASRSLDRNENTFQSNSGKICLFKGNKRPLMASHTPMCPLLGSSFSISVSRHIKYLYLGCVCTLFLFCLHFCFFECGSVAHVLSLSLIFFFLSPWFWFFFFSHLFLTLLLSFSPFLEPLCAVPSFGLSQ